MSTQHTLNPSTARVRLHVRARACAVGKANLANDMLADTELQKLIGEDKAFERILDQLKTLQRISRWSTEQASASPRWRRPT